MRVHTPSTGLFALLTPALLLLGSAWLATPAVAAPAPKVDVCHVPPGNPANAHVINVSQNALPAHLRHGDFVGVGAACSVGVGECRAEGTTQCDAAGSCSAVPGAPSHEVCDGLDNDCDGVVDNGTGDGTVCTAGVGECAVDGETICTTDGELGCDAVPAQPPEDAEATCDDGRDNDCDGNIDAQDPDCDVVCPCAATWENGASLGAPDIRTQTAECAFANASADVIRVNYSPGEAYALVRGGDDDYCADATIGGLDEYNYGVTLTDEGVSACKSYLEELGCDFGG